MFVYKSLVTLIVEFNPWSSKFFSANDHAQTKCMYTQAVLIADNESELQNTE